MWWNTLWSKIENLKICSESEKENIKKIDDPLFSIIF